jgi:hypothetical protein
MLSNATTALLLLHVLCVVLHVATAAAWFGLALRLAGQARAVAAAGPAVGAALAADGGRAVRKMTLFLGLTFVFALGALFTNGGFEVYGWPYHASLGLLLALLAVQLVLVAPGWRALQRAVEGGGPATDAAAAKARVASGVGLGHLLWFAILVLMFWHKFVAALSVR